MDWEILEERFLPPIIHFFYHIPNDLLPLSHDLKNYFFMDIYTPYLMPSSLSQIDESIVSVT